MTPKAAILEAGDTPLLSNLDKPRYLHCKNEHNSIPAPIPPYDYTVINRLYYITVNYKDGMNSCMNLWHHAPEQT